MVSLRRCRHYSQRHQLSQTSESQYQPLSWPWPPGRCLHPPQEAFQKPSTLPTLMHCERCPLRYSRVQGTPSRLQRRFPGMRLSRLTSLCLTFVAPFENHFSDSVVRGISISRPVITWLFRGICNPRNGLHIL